MKSLQIFDPGTCSRFFFLIVFSFTCITNIQGQIAPLKLWDKTIGGNFNDGLGSLHRTSDGGYIIGGSSNSGISGDKSEASRGGADYWVIKLDSSCNKIWDKTFGGVDDDYTTKLYPTSDGGYIVGGTSLSGVGGDKTQPSNGNEDYWIVRLDSSGNKIWDRTFGGDKKDFFTLIQQTTDGGFIIGGTSNSTISGQKSQAPKGLDDFWIIKIDANGNKLWDKVFGGSLLEELFWLQQTTDGGYILGGLSNSGISGNKTQPSQGVSDFWIIKLNANGIKMWDKTYGGTAADRLTSLQQTTDGGYILGGTTSSQMGGNISQPLRGLNDYWVIRIDSIGNKIWDKRFGGSQYEELITVKQTPDGGFILGGMSDSGISGDKTQSFKGGWFDFWLVKVDSAGTKQWDKGIGGDSEDIFSALIMNLDGSYILGGGSNSSISGDKSQLNKGMYDIWLVKLIPDCTPLTATMSATCSSGAVSVNVNVSGAQRGPNAVPFWTLTYSMNGNIQTYSGTTSTFNLGNNISPGTTYSLISIESGICVKNLSDSLKIEPLPDAPQVNSISSCFGDSVNLTATGAPIGGSYALYDLASGGVPLLSSSSGLFTLPSLDVTTIFYVAAVNNAGCEGPRAAVTATIKTLSVSVGMDKYICVNADPIQLTGSPAGGTWSGANVSGTGLFTPTNTGAQTITYIVLKDGCKFTDTLQIIVKPVMQFSLGTDREACEGEAVVLKTESQPGVFLWSDGSTDSILTVYKSGEYWVKFMLNDCVTTDTIQVTFRTCPDPFIPNMVTSNNDGKNDFFSPQNLPAGKWQLRIFNRWGLKVFESENYQNNWPDQKIYDGTYYYLLRNSETGKQFKGWVEVAN